MKEFEVAKFYDENMKRIKTDDLHVVDIEIPAVPFEPIWGGGSEGIPPIYYGSDIQQREITAEMMMISKDVDDYYLLRSDLYRIFGYDTPFYIVLNREPGKRYKVVLNSSYVPERILPTVGKVEIPFITRELPYAESIGTSQDIERNGISSKSALWSFGMGLIADDDSLKYTFNATRDKKFKVYNPGSASIHPFKQELKITISNIEGASKGFELRNGNSTWFGITEKVNSNEKILLDGPNITSNGRVIDPRTTNRGLIQLNTGWNWFTLKGANSAKIEIDTRFYYN